jgi:excinuclease ABC subunit A
VVLVDQSAVGKTPRSNPAVYIGAFEALRELYAQSEGAQQRGLTASAFSFNSPQGQCERCRGAGFEKIEMQFLSDVYIRCPECGGRRYRPHVLEARLTERAPSPGRPARRWSIADVLEATVDESLHFLAGYHDTRAARRAAGALRWLQRIGLGYLRLGQPLNTLSGGESQRIKLVRYLAEAEGPDPSAGLRAPKRSDAKASSGESRTPTPTLGSAHTHSRDTLFLFDEPTTGLHFDDIRVLLEVFQGLVEQGNSVVVIEHNLEVIKCADWVIDLGPEAGEQGGRIVAQGPPEQIARCAESHTGQFLGECLARRGLRPTEDPSANRNQRV